MIFFLSYLDEWIVYSNINFLVEVGIIITIIVITLVLLLIIMMITTAI